MYLECHLKGVWDWLIAVMDSTEGQLRFGAALSETSDQSHPGHPLYSTFVRNQRERPAVREEPRVLQVLGAGRRSRFGAPPKVSTGKLTEFLFFSEKFL